MNYRELILNKKVELLENLVLTLAKKLERVDEYASSNEYYSSDIGQIIRDYEYDKEQLMGIEP